MKAASVKKIVKREANPTQAKVLQRFFKTGKGEYGEGDVFLGIKVPVQRKIAHQFQDLPLREALKLLRSKIHEERLVALLILVRQFSIGSEQIQKTIYHYYLRHTRFINNWDLVDLTAPNIVGTYLRNKTRRQLYRLVQSSSIWERRIAVLACFAFIRENDFTDSIKISELLLTDPHDLIHKAVGWMLREVGKRDRKKLEQYLKIHAHKMPRIMLRYAIEKFPVATRKHYLER